MRFSGREARKRQILDLMGVEVWRPRTASHTVLAPAAGLEESADGESGDTAPPDHWRLSLNTPGEPGGILIVRDVGHDTKDVHPVDRLTEAIASALAAGSAAPCIIDARHVPSNIGEPDDPAESLADALTRLQPTLLVSLGCACGRWMVRSLRATGVRDVRVLVADDPMTLLVRPERKAVLWRQFLSMGAGDASG